MLFRIFKMIATSGFLTALECTKFVFGRGSARPRSWFKGDLLLTGMGKGRGGRKGKGRRGEGKGEGREGDGPPIANSWIRP